MAFLPPKILTFSGINESDVEVIEPNGYCWHFHGCEWLNRCSKSLTEKISVTNEALFKLFLHQVSQYEQ